MQTVNGIGTTIYGRAKRHQLFGANRSAAEQVGYRRESYQVVKWFVLFYMPVVPLGTYRVLKVQQKFWTLEFPRYSMTKVDWDWGQISLHYGVAYGWLIVLMALSLVS